MRLMSRYCPSCHGRQGLIRFDGHVLWYGCACGAETGVIR